MAMPSSKSPSLGRSNPNSRSSEISDPLRRSFSGNPFAKPSVIVNPGSFLPNTPVNTPSDFPRRNSIGGREGAGSLRDHDDKENGKDQILKPAKVRSPAPSSKSAKNFMSPTISASSKFTVSPRKKVLVERNEPARISVSSSEGRSSIRKVTFAEPLGCSQLKPVDGIEQEKFEMHNASLTCEDLSVEAVHDTNFTFNPENDTKSSFETFADEPDCVNLDPTFKLSPTPPPVSSTSTILAPLDADPSLPPYDPKTNYLSPRPQFLHYKPKPRIELYKESELEGGFMSGSFSETEVTEDAQSEGSQKESEGVSSDEVIEEVSRISEPSPARTFMPEETVEAKVVPKPRFFMRSKSTVALLLFLSVALISISVANPPAIEHTLFEDLYEVYESSNFSEFAKANFYQFAESSRAKLDGLARNFHTWFTKALSSISEFISDARRVPNLGHLQYCNLTTLQEYNAVHQGPIFGPGEKEIDDTLEEDPPVVNVEDNDAASDSEIDTDEDIGDISVEHYDLVYKEQAQDDMGIVENASDASESEEMHEGQSVTVIEAEQALQPAEVSEASHSETDMDLKDQPGLYSDSEATEIHIEVFKAGNLEAKELQEHDANVNVDKNSNLGLNDQPGLNSEVAEIHTEEAYGDNGIKLTKAEEKSVSVEAIDLRPRMVLYLLLFGGTVLITGASFKWSRKGNSRSKRVTSSVEQPSLFSKSFHANSLPYPKQQSHLDKLSQSLSNVPTEMDMLGESCPSEMSSFQKSSSYSRKAVKELQEVHSLEKKKPKKRRESLASSSEYSVGSTSYGSFTTYEKIPTKIGRGDEETIVTPVRRSSRIRSQATSL